MVVKAYHTEMILNEFLYFQLPYKWTYKPWMILKNWLDSFAENIEDKQVGIFLIDKKACFSALKTAWLQSKLRNPGYIFLFSYLQNVEE